MRILTALLALCLSLSLFAANDDRAEKEKLVGDAVALLDVRQLTEVNLRLVAAVRFGEEQNEVINRVLKRLDYARIGDEVYGPVFRDNFTTEELRQVVEFYRSKAGQKTAKIYPALAEFAIAVPSQYVYETIAEVRAEMDSEHAKFRPDLAAMKELRTIATCLEARATDENTYPTVTFDALPPLLEPVYVRKLPRVDPWGTPYFYISDGQRYRVVSAGADRRFESSSRVLGPSEAQPRPMDDLDADIIFQNGNFRQYPRTAGPSD